MDLGVASALSSGISSFSADSLSYFALVLPVGLGILITISVAFASYRWFGSLSGLIAQYSFKSHFGTSFQRGASADTVAGLKRIRGY